MKIVYAAALLLVLLPAQAESQTAIEGSVSGDHLSNGSPDWRSEELRLSKKIAERRQIDATLRRISRFSLSDTQIEVNYALPLVTHLTGLVTAGGSASHRFLPKSDLGASLQYEFASAWLLNAGAKSTEYDNASVDSLSLGLEHYFSAFRFAVEWRPTRAMGKSVPSSNARLDYYYSDFDWVGILLAGGKEAANSTGSGVTISAVRSLVILGRHGWNKEWALRYGIERVKQGDFYNRTGARVGVQYTF